MKILSLKLKNINSLKGEVTIDFQDERFQEVGIFGIVGPTGAGKSSLLDAISLALYGRVPRLGSKAKPEQVVSHGERKALAEVRFRVKGEEYMAKWTASVAKGSGNVTVKRELADAEGKILSDKIKEIEDKIEEITGLDFNHFGRSVMLAQGSFAAFLEAKDNERSALLEKITGSDIYRRISQAVYQKTTEKKNKLKTLQEQQESLELLSPEAKKEREVQIQSLRAAQNSLKEAQAKLQQEKENKQKISAFSIKINQLERELQALQAAEEAQREELQQLARYKAAQPLQADLRHWQEKEKELKTLVEKIAKIQESITQLTQEKEHAAQEAKTQATEKERLEKEWETQSVQINQARQLDKELKTLAQQGKAEKAALQEATKSLKMLQEAQNRQKKELTQQHILRERTAAWLKYHAKDADLQVKISPIALHAKQLEEQEKKSRALQEALQLSLKNEKTLEKQKQEKKEEFSAKKEAVAALRQSLDALESEREALLQGQKEAQLHQALKKAEQQAQSYETLQKAQKNWNTLISDTKNIQNNQLEEQKKHDKFTKGLNQLSAERARAEKALFHAREKAELEAAVLKLEDERQKLQKGEPCPLCGAREHPFMEGHNYGEGRHRKERDAIEAKIKELDQRIKNGEKHLQDVEKVLVRLQEQAQSVSQKQTELRQEFGETLEITAQEVQSRIGKMQLEIEQYAQRLARIQALQTERDKTHKNLDAAEKAKQKALEALQHDEKQLDALRLQRESQLQQRNELLSAQKETEEELEKLLTPFEVSRGLGFLKALQQRNEEFQQQQESALRLERATAELKQQIEKKEQEISFSEKTKQSLENSCEKLRRDYKAKRDARREILGDNDADTEEKRLLAARNQARERAEKTRARAEEVAQALASEIRALQEAQDQERAIKQASHEAKSVLKKTLKNAGFQSIEDLIQISAFAERAKVLSKIQEERENKIREKKALHAEQTNELKHLEKLNSSEHPLAEIEKKLQALEAEREQHIRQQTLLQEQLTRDEELQKKQTSLLDELQKSEKEYALWSKMNAVIGSAGGDVFSKYAQSLTLGFLLQIANRYLSKLHGRYQIRKVPTAEADEKSYLKLEIIDRWQADNIRNVKLLSGGETFLVSLALALGLSELAGGETQIETLFIDEGFGTLDAETLETAVSVLENLQAQGKTIGVISHVKMLKERLPLQIVVEKVPGSGFSKVRVIED